MAVAEILLTEEQCLELMEIPHNINEYEIGKHYTFSPYDVAIKDKHRTDYNLLGFAVYRYSRLY